MNLDVIWNLPYSKVLEFLEEKNIKTAADAYIRMSQMSVNDLPVEEQLLVNNNLFTSEMLKTNDLPQDKKLEVGISNMFDLDHQLRIKYKGIIYYKKTCKFVEFNEEYDPIDPISGDKLKNNCFCLNQRCYNQSTIKKILKKENPRDPFTRELIPQYFINKYGDKPFKFRGRELNEHFGDLYLDLSGLNLTDEDLEDIVLPEGLIQLDLSNNKLTSFSLELPEGLEILGLSNNQIIDFSSVLPQSLEGLYLKYNPDVNIISTIPLGCRLLI